MTIDSKRSSTKIPGHNAKPLSHLLVIEDQLGKRTIALEAATCTIGRDPSNSIVLHSELVSRHHASLLRVTTPENASHLFRIIDGNFQGKRSTNGLMVNGQRCYSHNLKHGDVMVFGGDVTARYYATINPSDIEYLVSCEAQDLSGFLADLRDPFQTLSGLDSDRETASEAALARLASFPELISNPIIESDLAGNITYLNPAAILQFPDIRQEKLQHPILNGLTQAVQDGQAAFFVREVNVKNLIFEQSVHYIAASDLIRSHIVDITERKRTQAALRDSERRFRAIFNQAFQFSWLLKPDGTLLEANQTALDFGGLNHTDVIDHPFWTARWWTISPETQHSVQQAIVLAASGQFVRHEIDIRGQGDRIATIDFSIKPVKNELDQVILLIPEGRDISDRKQVEAALQKAHDDLEIRVQERTAELKQTNEQLRSEFEERHRTEAALHSSYATNRALLNAIPDWMFRIGSDGTFVNYKAPQNSPLPLPSAEFLGKSLDQVLPEDVAKALMGCVAKALATHEMQMLEYQLVLKDIPLDYEARIAVSTEDEVIAIVRDITERKRAEADIRNSLEKEKQLSELKSRFVSMASHEFRTPLATILSSAELLEHYRHKWSEEKNSTHLKQIQQSVKHMTELLNEVLLIGKADAGKIEFNPQLVNVTHLCQEIVEGMQITTEIHQIIFQTQDSTQQVEVDRKLFRHIFNNLLSNAIKYSPKGGNIYVDLLFNQTNEVILSVKDEGIGIPQGEQDQVFNSFDRASNVGTIAGTGLGLAIVQRAVALHHGSLSCSSEVGVGTTFTVTLPLNQLVELHA